MPRGDSRPQHEGRLVAMVDSETDDPPAVEISPRFVFSRSTHYWRFHLRRV